jgi:hypothetical protein
VTDGLLPPPPIGMNVAMNKGMKAFGTVWQWNEAINVTDFEAVVEETRL